MTVITFVKTLSNVDEGYLTHAADAAGWLLEAENGGPSFSCLFLSFAAIAITLSTVSIDESVVRTKRDEELAERITAAAEGYTYARRRRVVRTCINSRRTD